MKAFFLTLHTSVVYKHNLFGVTQTSNYTNLEGNTENVANFVQDCINAFSKNKTNNNVR